MKTTFLDPKIRNAFFVLVITLTLSILLHPGMQGTDDLGYATKANSILENGLKIDGDNHGIGRIGTYLPLALMFRVFGINEFSLSLIPIVCTALTSVIICLIGTKLYGNSIGLLGGLLFSFFPLTLRYGNLFFPEPILIFLSCSAVYLFLISNGKNEKLNSFLKISVGILIGFAYLTAEVGSLMLPVLIITQLISRKASKKDLLMLLGFALVLSTELVYFWAIYDNPLHRFTGLGGNYINDPMLIGANKDLFYRLFKAYPSYFLYPEKAFGLFGPLLICGAIHGVFNFKKNILLLIWATTILSFFNFMTVSFDQYIVLPTASRLIYPGLIPLIILSANFILTLWRRLNKKNFIPFRILKCCIAMAIVFVAIHSILISHLRKNTHVTAVIARNAQSVAEFVKSERKLLLISDEKTLYSISFYRGLRDSDELMLFSDYEKLRYKNAKDDKKKIIVVNGPIYNNPMGDKGWFHYNDKSKKIVDEALAKRDKIIFHSKFNRGVIFDTFLSLGIIEMIMSEVRYKSLIKLISGKNPSDWVTAIEE